MTFVDTSALLAFLDRDAARHAEVVAAMTDVLTQRDGLTHNYIVIEAEALIHRRYGAAPARLLLQDVIPLLDIVWITPDLHAAAVVAHLADLRRRTSLVDHMSFTVMREHGITDALALDRHFAEAGFKPGP
ncbi:PIN domain-containing protein [Conexibacter arvalis]|uniref:Putative nucleic acid-binding protein n=1 Tax=Conexibacter arvalis TaxID=912552 RepID=A0A840I6K7_9ACTN|nr:putative nucleic acid-binding protein [Conexibacter arvalis]